MDMLYNTVQYCIMYGPVQFDAVQSNTSSTLQCNTCQYRLTHKLTFQDKVFLFNSLYIYVYMAVYLTFILHTVPTSILQTLLQGPSEYGPCWKYFFINLGILIILNGSTLRYIRQWTKHINNYKNKQSWYSHSYG